MLKIRFYQFTATNLLLNHMETVEVKSVSAAWNHLRFVRDANINNYLTTALENLEVKVEGLKEGDKMPEHIIFIINKSGKVEFKDFNKVKKNKEVKETPKPSASSAAIKQYIKKSKGNGEKIFAPNF